MDDHDGGDTRMDLVDSDNLDFITDLNPATQSLLRIRPSKHSDDPIKPLYLNSNPLNWQKDSLPYVTHLTVVENDIIAAFSSPSDSFACFDPTTLACTRRPNSSAYSNPNPKDWGHPGGITEVIKDREQSSLFWSSGMDGRIGCHDLRQSTPLTGSIMQRRPLLSLDLSLDGNTIAAGTEQNSEGTSEILRSRPPTTAHSSTHSDDINLLAFHPVEPNLLLSGAVDGLLSISNFLEPDEDETVVHMVNWGCSIARAGWFPSRSSKSTLGSEDEDQSKKAGWQVWSASDMETFAVWNSELDLIYEYGDVRKATSSSWQTDYIIDAEWLPANTTSGASTPWDVKGLTIWSGNNQGDLALLKQSKKENGKWNLNRILRGGHSEIVRSVCWMQQAGVLITGGEDGKLTAWRGTEGEGEGESPSVRNTQQDIEMEMSTVTTSPGQSRRHKMKRSSDEDLNLTKKTTKRQKIATE